jgi:hypothetical protein
MIEHLVDLAVWACGVVFVVWVALGVLSLLIGR